MTRRAADVITIPVQQHEEAVKTLARAFAGDPLMRYLFDAQTPGYTTRLRGFFRYTCAVHQHMGWPLLGVVPRTRVAGVACIAAPEQPEWPEALNDAYTAFTDGMDTHMLERIERYATLPSRNTPSSPQFYVKAIGVRPESHGQGYARLLLDAVHELSASHKTSVGVGLDTENAENVPLYENFGYRLVETVPFDGIDVYYMFRPNQSEQGVAR